MDLSDPASVALPTSSAAVIRVLAGADTSFTTREIGRLAGVSHTRAAQVVRALARHGVVAVEQRGRSHLCRLNRDHVATAPLVALVSLRRALLDRLRDQVSDWGLPAVHVSVFGSAARGDGGLDSDIDLLVVRPDGVDADDDDWAAQLHQAADAAYHASGNALAWFEVSMAELRQAVRAREAIIREWRQDAVHLGGRRLEALLREVT